MEIDKMSEIKAKKKAYDKAYYQRPEIKSRKKNQYQKYGRIRIQKLYQYRKENNLCRKCGIKLIDDKFVNCAECRKKINN